MIRKFKPPHSEDIMVCKEGPNDSYEFLWEPDTEFYRGTSTFSRHLEWLNALGWSEVFAGIDPNDAQCDHRAWNRDTDTCAICGKDWNSILWSPTKKPCCGGNNGAGPYYYGNGSWHSKDCDSLKPPNLPETAAPVQTDYRPKPSYRCDCGAAYTSNPNCHATWCSESKK